MRFAVHILPRLTMMLALVLAMVGTGFAHRYDRTVHSPDYAAFVAAGGTLSDLCGDSTDPDHGARAKCEACRLTAAALMPSHPETPGLRLVQRPRTRAAVVKPLHRDRPRGPAHRTRAPPAPLTFLL
ncbi:MULTISPECIES: DUF2946 family protein [unclassified Phaeobacter]|uniref:DUF2946 family protein n=1 Tax=unclassified Phaeobacter TaxID=2621772 RepID=UPI003A8A6FD6